MDRLNLAEQFANVSIIKLSLAGFATNRQRYHDNITLFPQLYISCLQSYKYYRLYLLIIIMFVLMLCFDAFSWHWDICIWFNIYNVLVRYDEKSSIHWSINRTINELINKSINKSINRSINPSIHPSINESTNQPINQSIDQSINRHATYLSALRPPLVSGTKKCMFLLWPQRMVKHTTLLNQESGIIYSRKFTVHAIDKRIH